MKTRHVVPSSTAFIAAAVGVIVLSPPLPGLRRNKGHSPICPGIGRAVVPSRCLLDRTKRSDAAQLIQAAGNNLKDLALRCAS